MVSKGAKSLQHRMRMLCLQGGWALQTPIDWGWASEALFNSDQLKLAFIAGRAHIEEGVEKKGDLDGEEGDEIMSEGARQWDEAQATLEDACERQWINVISQVTMVAHRIDDQAALMRHILDEAAKITTSFVSAFSIIYKATMAFWTIHHGPKGTGYGAVGAIIRARIQAYMGDDDEGMEANAESMKNRKLEDITDPWPFMFRLQRIDADVMGVEVDKATGEKEDVTKKVTSHVFVTVPGMISQHDYDPGRDTISPNISKIAEAPCMEAVAVGDAGYVCLPIPIVGPSLDGLASEARKIEEETLQAFATWAVPYASMGLQIDSFPAEATGLHAVCFKEVQTLTTMDQIDEHLNDKENKGRRW
jgi:hypothetical protein